MNELAKLMVNSGVLSPTQVSEFRRWGAVQENDLKMKDPPKTAEEFMQEVERVLQKEDMVLLRETDFTALTNFLKNQRQGVLYLDTGSTSTEVNIAYTMSTSGEFCIPWMAEGISDLLVNGMTYLKTADSKVFFSEVRELFYGETKAFVVCRSSQVEALPEDQKV